MAQGRATNEPANYMALGFQAVKDTEAATFFFFKHLDGSGFEVDQNVTTEREGGDGQEAGLRYKTMIKADPAVLFNARAFSLARVFGAVLGQDVATIQTAASPLTDHFANPTASMPYLTAEQFFADEVERSTNVQLTSVVVEAQAGQPWKITANGIGGGTIYQRDVASVLTPARETARPFFFPGGSYVVEAVGNSKITKFRVEVQRSVDDNIQTTSLNREDVVPLNFDVNVDFTLKYENRTLYQKVQYNGGSNLQVDLPTSAFSAAAAAGSFLADINVPFLQYVDVKVNKLDPDGKTMYLDVSAMSLKNATYSVWTRVRNTDTVAYF